MAEKTQNVCYTQNIGENRRTCTDVSDCTVMYDYIIQSNVIFIAVDFSSREVIRELMNKQLYK